MSNNLDKIQDLIFPIVKILCSESDGTYEYAYNDDLVIISGNGEEFRIPVIEFGNHAVSLLKTLKEKTNGTFSVPEIETFMASFNCVSIKAQSTVKSDIRIVIHDHRTNVNPELGFSIKSQLGSASTLLNAGRTTNFEYLIEGCTFDDEQIEKINSIETKSKMQDRINAIYENSGKLRFDKTEKVIFGNNLTLIDSSLPNILGEMLLIYYTSGKTTTVDLADEITSKNPLGYDLSSGHPFYDYKIKRFLTDVALGMMPSKVWTGQLDATGGYLIVKKDGDILCYHIYNRNEFEEYLVSNTKFDTASSTRHEFGKIYKKEGQFFIKLNLQIRFIK